MNVNANDRRTLDGVESPSMPPRINFPVQSSVSRVFRREWINVYNTCMNDARCTCKFASIGGIPSKIICPRLAVAFNPYSMTFIFPVVSIVIVVPLSCVTLRISSSIFCSDAFMTCVAPSLLAISSLSVKRSTPTIMVQPWALAA